MDDPGHAAVPLEGARTLLALLRAAAPRIEAARALPQDVLAALHAQGMFRLTLPRALGGPEADAVTLMRVVETLAMADASTAWCVGQAAGCAMSAAYLPPDAARAVFGDSRAVLAWGAGASGVAVPVAGGWRVGGRWMFASGARHATWLGGLCMLAATDGTVPPGAPVRTFLFPREHATLTDTWHVIGLRGTGSDSYAVQDVLVPAEYCFDRTQPAAYPGTLYRIPLTHVYPLVFGALASGIAGAMLEDFTALAADKTPRGLSRTLRDNAAVQGVLGHMTARHRAARGFLLQAAAEIWADLQAGAALSPAHALSIRMASTFAIHEALAVVDAIYHEAGASAIFDGNPFERRLRDMHAVAQHVQGRRANYELVGQHLMGLTSGELFV